MASCWRLTIAERPQSNFATRLVAKDAADRHFRQGAAGYRRLIIFGMGTHSQSPKKAALAESIFPPQVIANIPIPPA